MPPSKKPRKPYHGPKSKRDLDQMNSKPPVIEPGELFPPPSSRGRLGGRRGMLIAAGATTAAGGGAAYVAHRRREAAAVTKLYNPFTDETVEFGKTTEYQSAIYDSRFGLPGQKKGKEDRKEMRRDFKRRAPKAGGIGAAAGGAVGGAIGAKYGHTKVGAGVGGLYGGLGGLDVASFKARSAQQRKMTERSKETASKSSSMAQLTSTSVSSVTPRPQRSGPTRSHGNDLKVIGRRNTKKPVMVEVHHASKSLSSQQGAATSGSRGTPMSGIMRAGRVGHRLTTV